MGTWCRPRLPQLHFSQRARRALRASRLAFVIVFSLSAFLAVASPASAAVSCIATATSTRANGDVAMEYVSTGPIGATPDNPFVIDPAGRVSYNFTAHAPEPRGVFSLRFHGFPVKEDGMDFTNGTYTNADSAAVGPYLDGKLPGLYLAETKATTASGECGFGTWILIEGNPLYTIAGLTATAILGGGALLLAFSLPRWVSPVGPFRSLARDADGSLFHRHPVRGTVGGVIAGFAAGLLVTFAGFAPVGVATWYAFVLPIGLAGFLVSWFGPKRQPAAPNAPEGATPAEA